MKVSNQSVVEQAQVLKLNIGSKLQEVSRQETVPSDKITVSSKAKEIAQLQAEVMKMPDIRADKVNSIKSAYEAGTYNVRGEAVAQKLLKEVIIDSFV